MAVQVSYPGVYIEEFTPGAPIEGVGTSTAAFIGIAAAGELDTPTKITSWDQFRATFGGHPVPGFFLWYAVRGFFENGGQVCYLVRASNGDYDKVILNDRADNGSIRVRARQPGDNANPPINAPISVQVTNAALVPSTTVLFQPTGALSANVVAGGREVNIGFGQGINFKPEDYITIATGGERVRVLRITSDVIANHDTLRLADGLQTPTAQETRLGLQMRLPEREPFASGQLQRCSRTHWFPERSSQLLKERSPTHRLLKRFKQNLWALPTCQLIA